VRVLLDTNVLVSAVLFGGLPRRLVDQALRGELDLVSGSTLLDEFEDVLIERFGFARAAARLTRAEVEAVAELVAPPRIEAVCRDADDDIVLATAVAGSVDVLITGDKDLLVLEAHGGVPICTPRQFAERPR
jgi:hypothetical protein